MYKITPPRNNLYHPKVHALSLFSRTHTHTQTDTHTRVCVHIHFSYFFTFLSPCQMASGSFACHVETVAFNKPAPYYWALGCFPFLLPSAKSMFDLRSHL